MAAKKYFSERNGRSSGYSKSDLMDIVWGNVQNIIGTQGLLDEKYGYIPSSWGGENLGPAADNLEDGEYNPNQSEVWLNRILKAKANFRYSPHAGFFQSDYGYQNLPTVLKGDLDRFFDFLEALHDVVSRPIRKVKEIRHVGFDKDFGQELLRTAINDDLALYTTTYRMLENGQIVEIDGGALADLADKGLATKPGKGVPKTSIDPLHDGISLYMKRGASKSEKKAAIKELASALESLRPKVKSSLLSEDERDLFSIANNFAIRHQTSKQKGNYNNDIWFDWMFHVNLAALVTTIEIIQAEKI